MKYHLVSDSRAILPTGLLMMAAMAPKSAFRVAPGSSMPPVAGCNKQDYSVLFVIGVAVEN